MRYLGSQMAAHHADPDPTAVQAITLHYLRVAREMGLADEVESPSRRLSPTLPLIRTLTRKVERLTRDPGAKYEPRAVLALLATDPPPPPAAPSTPAEASAYGPNPNPNPNLTPNPNPNLIPTPTPTPTLPLP